MTVPRYTHDCDGCEFLGECGTYDLYYCARCDEGTIIARASSDAPDYASTPVALLTKERREFWRQHPASWSLALLTAYDIIQQRK